MAIDFKSFSPNGPKAGNSSEWRRWWDLREDEQPNAITNVINHLHAHQSQRLMQLDTGTRLYGNISLMGLNGLSYSRLVTNNRTIRDRLTYNVVQSAIDTVTAKIAKNRPKPLFLTSGADYRLQKRAKNLGKFVDGVFYETEAYPKGVIAFRDGCIWGTGITHVYNSYGRVAHEAVIPQELFVDEVEAARGNPRQLHRVKIVDRMQLADMFPGKKKAIMNINPATYDQVGDYQSISDVIVVRESWHLPSGPEATDGKHLITIADANLLKENYTRDHFPFAFFHWNKKPIGFWGSSVCDELQNIQLEINKLLWVLQRSYHLAGSFKILLQNGSKIVKEHLTNDVGAIINYTGAPPQYVTPPIVPVEYYQHLEGLIQKAFNIVGVSQLSAASLKPQGLDSGKALREYNDIESDRFTTVGHNYERYFLDLAKLDIEEAKGIYEEEGKYNVPAFGRGYTIDIDWKDIDLKEDEYVMKEYPVSSLPDDPEGRLQTIQEYMQAGLMSPRTGRRLLDFPDLEQVEDLQNASEEYLNEVLQKIIEDGFYTKPEPYDDLQLALELGLEYYARGKNTGVEEEKLELIRQFIEETKMLLAIATAPQPQAMAPQAGPMPVPTSDMVQNVPGMQQPMGAPIAA